jgi:hypothetical protein
MSNARGPENVASGSQKIQFTRISHRRAGKFVLSPARRAFTH